MLLYDDREKEPDLLAALVAGAHSQNIDLARRRLSHGDYNWRSERYGNIAIERKSPADLCGSLTSGRLTKQARALIKDVDRPYLAITGSFYRGPNNTIYLPTATRQPKWNYDSVMGLLTRLELDGLRVVHLVSEEWFIEWLLRMYRLSQVAGGKGKPQEKLTNE